MKKLINYILLAVFMLMMCIVIGESDAETTISKTILIKAGAGIMAYVSIKKYLQINKKEIDKESDEA